ncbi:MAG: peptide MFS transporter, partial [Aeromonas veronii]
GEAGPIAIFGGIALAAVLSALILLTMANRLVYWMHGAEGPAKEPQAQEKKLQSATV